MPGNKNGDYLGIKPRSGVGVGAPLTTQACAATRLKLIELEISHLALKRQAKGLLAYGVNTQPSNFNQRRPKKMLVCETRNR